MAKTQLEKYIAGGGKDVAIYGSLAMLYKEDNEIDKALATLDKGIALAPTNKDLTNEKINIMLLSNRMDEAIMGMKQMVEKNPNNVQNLVNLSIVYNNIGAKANNKQQQAESKKLEKYYLTRALAVDPNNFDANYNMGVWLFNNAVEMKKIVDVMPMAEYNKRGKVADGQVCGRFQQSLPYFRKSEFY